MRIAIRAETSHLQFHLNSGLQRTHHFLDAKAIACLPHGAIVVNAATQDGLCEHKDCVHKGMVSAGPSSAYERTIT